MAYLASKASVSVNLDKIKGAQNAQQYGLILGIGESVPIGTYPARGSKSFMTPEGSEDALVILEASAA